MLLLHGSWDISRSLVLHREPERKSGSVRTCSILFVKPPQGGHL